MKIENSALDVAISLVGAELQSIKSVETGKEYLWQGDPEFWARRAPLLFPVVGQLKGDAYKIGEESYSLGKHGFARDSAFDVVKWNPTEIVLSLKS